MFLIWGFGRRTVKDHGSVGSRSCGRCNNDTDMHLLKITTWFTLFFIPLIPYRVEYVILCPICNNGLALTKEEFLNMTNGGKEVHDNRYAGKTETQIAYLKQMEELRQSKEA